MNWGRSMQTEVVVCGGGMTGVAAAVSAAREGCETVLVEKQAFLGGIATGGLVIPISGFFHKGKRVIGGFAWELVERLEAVGAAQVEYPKGHVSVHPEYVKLLLQRLLLESGVTLCVNSTLCRAEVQDGFVRAVTVLDRNGCRTLTGKCFVDATGDAVLCRFAGVPMQPEDRPRQPLSLCFLLGGVDASTPLLRDSIHHNGIGGAPSCNSAIRDYLMQCVAEGKLRQFGGPWFNTLLLGNVLAVNVTRLSETACSSLSEVETQLREDMFTVIGLLQDKYPEFRSCFLISSGVSAGVRESCRVQGRGTLTAQMLLSGEIPSCPVAACAHPMDMHSADGAQQELRKLDRPGYVPHETLIPVGMRNLLAAGRCFSADQETYASARVQATCLCMGEAAGIMAAMCARTGMPVPSLPLEQIAERIRDRRMLNL